MDNNSGPGPSSAKTDSEHDSDTSVPASVKIKNSRGKHVGSEQRLIALNAFNKFMKLGKSKTESIKLSASEIGIGVSTMWKVVKEMETGAQSFKSPSKKRLRTRVCDKLGEFEKEAIRQIVYAFFQRNETPTLNKVLQTVKKDENMPPLSRSSLWKVLKKLGFMWEKRCGNHTLIEKEEIGSDSEGEELLGL